MYLQINTNPPGTHTLKALAQDAMPSPISLTLLRTPMQAHAGPAPYRTVISSPEPCNCSGEGLLGRPQQMCGLQSPRWLHPSAPAPRGASELSAGRPAANATLPGSLAHICRDLPLSISQLGLEREELCAPGPGLGTVQAENNYRALWKPESAAETWTRWPETRQMSIVRQCRCPSGLID